MKLLTINTHSLIEENYEKKLRSFVNTILIEKPDIIAMQEVNQSCDAALFSGDAKGFVECNSEALLREDNHALRAAKLLYEAGMEYFWTWLPIKTGYEKYDEGLAVFSRRPIEETDGVLVSTCNDYNNWKRRKILGIRSGDEWFYTVHMGWWNDEEEPFIKQWERLSSHLQERPNVWLMGDFNSRADIRNEGYDCISSSGWIDTYSIAKEKDDGFTVTKKIDGWNDSTEQMRIDYIWSSRVVPIKSSRVIFNDINGDVISDHFGVIVTV